MSPIPCEEAVVGRLDDDGKLDLTASDLVRLTADGVHVDVVLMPDMIPTTIRWGQRGSLEPLEAGLPILVLFPDGQSHGDGGIGILSPLSAKSEPPFMPDGSDWDKACSLRNVDYPVYRKAELFDFTGPATFHHRVMAAGNDAVALAKVIDVLVAQLFQLAIIVNPAVVSINPLDGLKIVALMEALEPWYMNAATYTASTLTAKDGLP